MYITFIDKDFQKHVSLELDEKSPVKAEFINQALDTLKQAVPEEDIRVIEWDKKALWHLKDYLNQ